MPRTTPCAKTQPSFYQRLLCVEDKARQILEVLKQRGCKEVFEANPTLLADGLVGGMCVCVCVRGMDEWMRALDADCSSAGAAGCRQS
jgi:hypothetical protein